MARKSARSQSAEPEAGPQDGVEEGTGGEGRGKSEPAPRGIKKVDAVRKALAAGRGSPEDGTAYIRRHFAIDMKNTQFSTIKSNLKKREEGPPAPDAPAEPRKPLVEGYVAPPPKPPGEPDVLLALESVKELVETYGADKVRRIVDLLS